MDPSDNDYWTWREENDRVIQQQAEEQQMYGAMHETMHTDAQALSLAFDSAVTVCERARRIRETEGL